LPLTGCCIQRCKPEHSMQSCWAAHGAFVRRASTVKPHLKTGLVCMHHSSRLSPILDLCPASQKLKPIFSSHLARVNMDFPKHHPMPLKEHVFPLFSRIEPAHLVTSSKLRQIQTGIKGKDLGIPTISVQSNPSLKESDSMGWVKSSTQIAKSSAIKCDY